MSGTRGAESGALVASPLLRAPGRSTFQSHPFSCMAWSASRGRRSSSVGSCGACKLRASTTTCCPCGSRGACECAAGLRGLQGREGGASRSSPHFYCTPLHAGRERGEVQAEKGHWPSGLGPQPEVLSRTLPCPANPRAPSQPASLPPPGT